nr:protein GPR108-like [Danio rerio]|eukprot:XP_017211438.1 protein GPR108-like [Danio rerio]
MRRMMMMNLFGFMLLILTVSESSARIHQLKLQNETRFIVHLNTFGYFANGFLEVQLLSLNLPLENSDSGDKVGFSLTRTRVNGLLSYTAEEVEECRLTKTKSEDELILFIDTKNLKVNVKHLVDSDIRLEPLTTGGEKARRRRADPVSKDEKVETEDAEQKETAEKEEIKGIAPLSSIANKQVESVNTSTLELQQQGESYHFSVRNTHTHTSNKDYTYMRTTHIEQRPHTHTSNKDYRHTTNTTHTYTQHTYMEQRLHSHTYTFLNIHTLI